MVLALAAQSSLSAQQRRGREIYTVGTSAGGEPIVALLGEDELEVPATILPCSNCHGDDGHGNPEGGVTPSDITWSTLTKPYGTTTVDGRRRPPYDKDALARAIIEGIDAGGGNLNATMPRYRIGSAAIADLLAYLEIVGEVTDPGIDDTSLTVGIVLPPAAELGEMGDAIESLLHAYFSEVNRRGGMYGRQISLRFIAPNGDGEQRAAAVRTFIEQQLPFVIGAGFIAGADDELAALADDLQTPLLGAVSLYPNLEFPLNRYVFYLYAGIPEQGRALAVHAVAEFPAESRQAAVVFAADARSRRVADAIGDQLDNAGSGPAAMHEVEGGPGWATALAAELSTEPIQAVFFVGSGTAAIELLRAADETGWRPLLFMPASSVGAEIFDAPPSSDGRIFLAFPTFPSDRTAEAMLEYRSLVEAYGLSLEYQSIQLTALSAARLLLEGLARSGRELSREKLIRAIEGLYEFETGLTPPLSYGPNRRIGALGAYVVPVDLIAGGLGADVEWIPLR